MFVAEDQSGVVGSDYLHANQLGGGDHVANCGYTVRGYAGGCGVAAAIGRHSMDHARAAGFAAMQFNFVVSMNESAIALWARLRFEIVGRRVSASDAGPDRRRGHGPHVGARQRKSRPRGERDRLGTVS